MKIDLQHGDCLDVLPLMSSDSIDLCFADPPYNIGVFMKMPPSEYLAWCEEWIKQIDRVLVPNGAFWISHKDPVILSKLSDVINRLGRDRINWITWDKLNGNPAHQAVGGPMIGMTKITTLRSFQVMAEYLVFHAANDHSLGQELRTARLAKGLSTIDVGEHFKTHPGRINHVAV